MVKAIPKECVALVTLKTEEPVVVEPIEASCKALGRFALMQGTDIVGGGLVSKVL
jgi:translation elongation factor EF-1alpha